MVSKDTKLAKRLRLLSALYDYSQKDILAATDIPRGSISAHMQGKYNPKPDQLVEYARIFNVSVDYLLGVDDPTLEEVLAEASDEHRLVEICQRIEKLWKSGDVETVQIIEAILNSIGRE